MALRAWARTIFSAAGSPGTTARRGFTAGLDTAVGRVTYTLDRPVDRTEACTLCSWVHAGVGTGIACAPLASGTIEADIASGDTTVEVRMRQSSGATADPAIGTGFCVAVFDNIGG